MKKKNPYADFDYDAWVAGMLAKLPDYSNAYLAAVMAEYKAHKDKRIILSGLKHIALAQGIGRIADRVGMSRVTLSRALSENGNPRFETLLTITEAMGLGLSFTPVETKKKRA